MSEAMTINDIINQLGSLRASSGSERGRQWRRGTESPTAKSSPW